MGFFGKMSPFEIGVAVVALANAIYTAYISFFQRAAIRLYLGDHVGIVLNPGDVGRKLHLRCNFVNSAVKMGTVHHLEVLVRGPQNFAARFRWHLFYEYIEGGEAVRKIADVYPLAVGGRDSHLEFIESEAIDFEAGQRPNWRAGRYTAEVEGWVNRRDRRQPPNLRRVCHINLSEESARLLRESHPVQQHFIPFPIEEWATGQ
jgi:hypothetical protein